MNPTVYLHIGMNKTGTTAIQRFFSKHQSVLKDYGLLYPSTGHTGSSSHSALSSALGFEHKKNASNVLLVTKLQQTLKRELKETKAQQVLFSSEYFSMPYAIEPVKTFFSDYDTRIIIYLRRHDEWWQSYYNQAVKCVANPLWNSGFKQFVQFQKKNSPYTGNYRKLVNRWATVFGQENIIIRPYEAQQNQPNIVADLLCTIGFNDAALQLAHPLERVNESPSFFTLQLIDSYQRANIDSETRRELIKYLLLNSKQAAEHNESTPVIPPRLRRQLIKENLADYEYIAKNYLGRENGQLFYDPLPDPKEPWEAPQRPNVVAIVEETIKAMEPLKTAKKSYWLW